jgi:hypothetical protein
VICIDNSDYPVSLDLLKISDVLPDARAAENDCIRVIDESGDDYLYSSESFVSIELPQKVIVSMRRHIRESKPVTAQGAHKTISKNQPRFKSKVQSSSRVGRG